MKNEILYAGDTSLTTAASYLAGVMTHYEMGFDYLASDEPMAQALGSGAEQDLYILSDYPVNNLTEGDFQTIISNVEAGSGLLMIGGWESFHGQNGEYNDSPLVDILPVEIANGDDRVNSPFPCVMEPVCDHVITANMPFAQPPTIGGYNLVRPKPGANMLIGARHLNVRAAGNVSGEYELSSGQLSPLLVVGKHGKGRTAALMTDVAPHWVGGFVDWGDERVTAQGPGANQVEVGSIYAAFFCRLLSWTMGRLD